MRKLYTTLGVLVAFALFPAVGIASHSTTDNPPNDFANAFSVHASGGSLGAAEVEISLSAVSGPAGENASGGGFSFLSNVGGAGGSVACLNVSGNTATIGGIVQGGNNPPTGTVVAFTVVDNSASGGQDTVTNLEPVTGPAESACQTPVAGPPGTVVDDPTGERLVVHDATGNPPVDFVVGGGYATGGSLGAAGADISLTAQSGPAGENASGDFSFFYFDNGTGAFGHVTCLNVNGNTATVAGVVEGGGRVPTGTVVAFTIVGNTTPETATGVAAVTGSPESACRTPVASPPGTFLTLHSFLIFDALAPPEPPQEGKNRAKACKAERSRIGEAAFSEKYGTNRNRRNALGKCVSQKR